MSLNPNRPSIWVTVLCCVAVFVTSLEVRAAPSKDALAAAMVYRITKFVSWPETAFTSPDATFNICFDQADEVYTGLKRSKLKRWQGREVQVKADFSGQCHVAVHGKGAGSQPSPLVNQLAPSETHMHRLTISQQGDFLESGGHVALDFSSGRLIFRVNRTSARQAGLEFSSDFLNLAAEVK